MFNFRKVKPKGNGSKNKNQEDQKNYENKVEALRTACKNFGDYLKGVDENTEFNAIIEKFKDENKCFGKQMKKPQLLSRTSRRLNEMKKNLSKFKSKPFDPQKIDSYVECFTFKPKTSNSKGNIKRSAIDDEKVANFFNGKNNDSICGILSVKQKEAQKESGELNKQVSIALDQADESLDASKKARDEATGVQKEIAQTRTSVKSDKKIEPKTKRESMTSLNGQIGELGQDKSESQQAAQDLIEKQKETKKIMKDENSTPRERMGSLNKLRKATVANNAATDELNGAVDKAEEVHAEVEKDIEEAKADLFDEKTGTFTIRTEADFIRFKILGNNIEKVVIGEGITTIGELKFHDGTSLKSINLGNVQIIGESAFKGCKSLASIDFKNVQTIEERAFEGCTALASIDLGNVQIIGKSAFKGCTALASIDFKNVQTIEERAFEGCTALASIDDLENVTTIKDHAFDSCKALQSVDLKNVEDIECSTFDGCKKLQHVNLGIATGIGEDAFSGCTSLKSIDLKNVTDIYERAFAKCIRLKNVDFKKVTFVGEQAFHNCKALQSVDLKNVETIGKQAFYKCALLESADLENVTTVEDEAFFGCKKLGLVTLPADRKKAAEIKKIILGQTNTSDDKFEGIVFVNDVPLPKQEQPQQQQQ